MAIAADPSMRSALKHVARRHYFVRDMVEAGEIAVCRVGTADNVADICTKPMPSDRHRQLAARMRRGERGPGMEALGVMS